MTRYEDDGTVSLSRGEHYHVSGYVRVKVSVSFDTYHEPDEKSFSSDMFDAVTDAISAGDWDIVNEDLDYEIESD